ncbi:S-layer protein [Secundilactobacillus kimchicus]|uniref:S-layer protein n=1 Tax=Secundilactobacillus kimchicus TaxID=528209 RepID=UPI001C00FCF4|nr:S-layer protein [Secundilactobacillus kimchicus]MBT9671614.1 S-layer protein [Secundilactobacillus kimchicus]
MNKGLKKSLYFGLAAVSFLGAAGFASSNASAKTYARVTSNRLMTSEPGQRNVVTNGTNALYTKAGTLRGARVVASKSTLAQLGNSKSSQKYFRAYRVATTNRGSVYYKVVSFDQQYRGWIYGGTLTAAFGGGITTTDTMTSAALPSSTTGYSLVDINKNTLWESPKWSQYLAKQSDMSGYKAGDTFKIIGAATKSREGWLYYQVVDENNANVTGWVFADGLKQTVENGVVNINYVTSAGTSVGTAKWTIGASDLKSGATATAGAKLVDILNTTNSLTTAAATNAPKGYTIDTSANLTNLATLAVGGTYTVQVKAATTATSKFDYYIKSGSGNYSVAPESSFDQSTKTAIANADKSAFTGDAGKTISTSVYNAAPFTAGTGMNTITVGGKTYTFNLTDTLHANSNTTFGNTVHLYYSAS